MNTTLEFALRSLLIGAGATLTMDLWAAALRRAGIPSLNFAFLGRWIGHLPRGRWLHENIARTTPVRRELLIGWCVHYAIGVSFSALLLATFGLEWARSPTPYPALLIGTVTVIAPLFILQPALGAGMASSKTPTPVFNSIKSLVTHLVFGIGLFLSARITAVLLPTSALSQPSSDHGVSAICTSSQTEHSSADCPGETRLSRREPPRPARR